MFICFVFFLVPIYIYKFTRQEITYKHHSKFVRNFLFLIMAPYKRIKGLRKSSKKS